jgi:hypothetical protein
VDEGVCVRLTAVDQRAERDADDKCAFPNPIAGPSSIHCALKCAHNGTHMLNTLCGANVTT